MDVPCCYGATAVWDRWKKVAKLKIMCARSMHQVVGRLADDFRRRSGHDPALVFGTVGALQTKLDAGETADVVITGAPAMDRLEQTGALAPGSRTDLATTRIGVAVRDGAAAPDISSPEAFRRALVAAPRIAFSDAAVGGSAGVHLAKLFVELGLGEEIKRKGMPQRSGGEAAQRVAEGAADLVLTLIAEIVAVPGVRVVGPLPAPLGNDTTYCMAVHARCPAPEAARAFLAALADPATDAGWQAAGFERG
jgi:molybdate transport system substrate-binding protein